MVSESVKRKLMEETHAGSIAGHFVAKSLYIQHLILHALVGRNLQDAYQFCNSCLMCASHGGTKLRYRAAAVMFGVVRFISMLQLRESGGMLSQKILKFRC